MEGNPNHESRGAAPESDRGQYSAPGLTATVVRTLGRPMIRRQPHDAKNGDPLIHRRIGTEEVPVVP
jgi:hypothetical protein